jgi:competence protein ComEA
MQLKRRLPLWLLFGASLAACCFCLTGAGLAKALVDLNTASAQQLDTLKGIGPATARKIIANRPYTSVDDLARAGLSAKEIETLKPLVTVGSAAPAVPAAPVPEKSAKPAETGKIVDLNNAPQTELESLPGIGKISADKIIAGRPYTSVDGLAKAGISAKNIALIKPLVTVGPATKATSSVGAATAPSRKESKPAAPAKIVDLNTANQAELETLPGIGKSSAKKIMAHRPYASVDDLVKSGLSTKTIAEIKPLVSAAGVPAKTVAPAAPSSTAPATTPGTAAVPAPPKAAAPAKGAAAAPKLAPGQTVNINTASKEMLEALPEIGPVKAQAIIDHRPYNTIADIMKVKGIKAGTFNKIKDNITVK